MKTKLLKSLMLTTAIGMPITSVLACSEKATGFDPTKKDSVILIVGPIGHKDKGFNQGSHDGAQEAIKQIGKLTQYSEVKTTDSGIPAAKVAAKKALQAGTYVVLASGYQYPPFMNTEEFAGKYSDREFIGIDGAVSKGPVKPNVTAISFKAEKGAFLAGVAVGIYLAKNYDAYKGDGGLKVGGFGGGAYSPVKKMITGFIHGLAYYNDKLALNNDYKVKFVGWNGEDNGFTGGFSPSDKSIAKANSLIAKNADIVFPVAGGQVSSMVDIIKAQSKQIKIVGVDSDQSIVFGADGSHFITSVLKDTKVAAREALKAIYKVAGAKVTKGRNNVVGLDGGFVGIAKGDFDKEAYKGTALARVIKDAGGIDVTSEDTIYKQLTKSENEIYKKAETGTSDNWDQAKLIFGHASEKIPTLADFSTS